MYTNEFEEKEFYVCLLSNSSIGCYSTNVLSAFTNLLKKPCKLNEQWSVGLTEIAFNRFTPNVTGVPSIKAKRESHHYPETQSRNIFADDETKVNKSNVSEEKDEEENGNRKEKHV